ncbi:MAG: 1,4-alpha-glucan branching protein GlgB [Saprospiraceae bacterium]
MVKPHSLLTEFDIALFQSGKHFRLWEKLGSHVVEVDGERGTYFAVWAPNAKKVAVTGDFNGWNTKSHVLLPRWDSSGIWEGFIPGIGHGTVYKYRITSANNVKLDKGDPYARVWETPPKTASVVYEPGHAWRDDKWMREREAQAGKPRPWSVYEVHIGSWKKLADDANRSLNYRELATELVDYVADMGFTHVELMPVMEHPYFPSWGYQITGYFAPTSRFGSPEDFMFLIDAFHQRGIGVILDWVPSHFPGDIHGLYLFDGSHIYEYADPRIGYQTDWNSYIFDYGRNEVRSFLISNALFWLEKYHIDGLRVDAVASMLYRDYSRNEGQWIPNIYGGRENLEAISFLKEFNEAVYKNFPGAETIAEESTAFPAVSKPTWDGGLGFGQKWMMGWMHDTLGYFKRPPMYRPWHQNEITFSMVYAFSERFMLPLSHDEVVHLKASLIGKMPGDEWQRFANLRALFGHQWTHPGTHLLFMGGEIGQTSEWSHDRGIVWELLQYHYHKGVQLWVKALNELYRSRPAFWRNTFHPDTYEWISGDDTGNSVLAYLRKGDQTDKPMLVVCHFGPQQIDGYTVGVPFGGTWTEVLNSDDEKFGGRGVVNGPLKAAKKESHGKAYSISFRLAPLAVQIFEGEKPPATPKPLAKTAAKAPAKPKAKPAARPASSAKKQAA